ncbi:hypothetical protein [Streptomyces sp.]|uniref:hypothetical protein n=1 Tax=Streptomyces sp. TaxID=1931 RepID=UPI002D778F05|nr:hypothetical protein [Streptomyces sp.]HET6354550.1 hypothetical protein [Streptomyces sp.]
MTTHRIGRPLSSFGHSPVPGIALLGTSRSRFRRTRAAALATVWAATRVGTLGLLGVAAVCLTSRAHHPAPGRAAVRNGLLVATLLSCRRLWAATAAR